MPVFQASGLVSGMDTAAIIDQFVAVEKIPVTRLKAQQTAVQTQISSLGNIKSRLTTLTNTVNDLKANGVRVNAVQGTNTAFTATPTAKSLPGQYNVRVDSLATAAKWTSAGLSASGLAATGLQAGRFRLSIDGVSYGPKAAPATPSDKYIEVTRGMSLEQLATAINGAGAPVAASVVTASSGKHLMLSSTRLGYEVPADPADVEAKKAAALQVSFVPNDGATGESLAGDGTSLAPENAKVTIDGLAFERRTNALTDVLPGVTVNLSKKTDPAGESLVIAKDAAASKARVQKLVDDMNNVFSLIRTMTMSTPGAPGAPGKSASLAGDSTLQRIKTTLSSVVSPQASNGTTLNGLADLGISFDRDGYLGFNSSKVKFDDVLTNNPDGVANFFSSAEGFAAKVGAIVKSANEMVTTRTTGLANTVSTFQKRIDQLNKNADAYKQRLQTQFQQMEKVLSGLKTVGDFLTAQTNAMNNAKKQ